MITVCQRQAAEAAQGAKWAFRNHRISLRFRHGHFASWRCGRPGNGEYHFNVSVEPCRLFITGDVGDLVVQCHDHDVVAWAKRAVRDVDYFSGKVLCPDAREFSGDRAREALERLAMEHDRNHEEAKALKEDLLDVLDDEGDHAFLAAFKDSFFYDGDPPDFRGWSNNFLWCFEAVKWWVSHLTPGDEDFSI